MKFFQNVFLRCAGREDGNQIAAALGGLDPAAVDLVLSRIEEIRAAELPAVFQLEISASLEQRAVSRGRIVGKETRRADAGLLAGGNDLRQVSFVKRRRDIIRSAADPCRRIGKIFAEKCRFTVLSGG